jgi:uncharacterized membrane protein
VAIDWLHPAFWVLLVLAGLFLAWLFYRSRMGWLPAWFSRLLLVALGLVAAFRPESLVLDEPLRGLSILILDQSDSIDPVEVEIARTAAVTWVSGGENRLVIPFAAEPHIVDVMAAWPEVDGRASALLAALKKADSLLTHPEDAEVFIATDGLVEDLPSVAGVLTQLQRAGVTITLLPLSPRPGEGDLALGQILAPAGIWEGTTLDVILPVYSAQGFEAEAVTFTCNEQRLQPVGQGPNYLIFRLPRQSQGITILSAVLDAPGDPFIGNNESHAALWVFPPPQTLFVSSDLGGAIRFTQALRDYGLNIRTSSPGALDDSPVDLGFYQLIFLHNLQAGDLTADQMSALRAYVRTGYGGLIFLGGERTYSLGGFENTLLEPLLPVSLAPPPRSERSPMLTLLVLDRSGSMGVVTSEGVLPIDLAKESAMRVIEALSGEDYLGLATYSLDTIWHVPVRQLGEGLARREALDAVSQIRVDSITNMYEAMEEILAEIRTLPAETPQQRYMLLLSDGKSTDGSYSEFVAIAESFAEENVTISTIAMGEAADAVVMEAIAGAGNGRFYLVEDVSRLPAVMFAESQAAQGLRVQYGTTALRLEAPGHPVLSGMSPAALPGLTAYNALSSKADLGAEDILVTAGFGDPILSSWQYGLGRVTAWMGDAGEAWVQGWPNPQDEARFWSQVIRYSLPNPSLNAVQASVENNGLTLDVAVQVPSSPTMPGTRYDVVFTFADQAGQTRAFQVGQISPDTFELSMDLPAYGAYRGVVTYQISAGESMELPVPFAVNPPREWARPDPETGLANISDWQALTGAQISELDALMAAETTEPEPEPFLSARGWLILTLIILWPVDIALRRRFHPWH